MSQKEKRVWYCDVCGEAIEPGKGLVICDNGRFEIIHKSIDNHTCDNGDSVLWSELEELDLPRIIYRKTLLFSDGVLEATKANIAGVMELILRLTNPTYEKIRRYKDDKCVQDICATRGFINPCYYEDLANGKFFEKYNDEWQCRIHVAHSMAEESYPGVDVHFDHILLADMYTIPYDECRNGTELLDWIHQLLEKTWITKPMLLGTLITYNTVVGKYTQEEEGIVQQIKADLDPVDDIKPLGDSATIIRGRLRSACESAGINLPWC